MYRREEDRRLAVEGGEEREGREVEERQPELVADQCVLGTLFCFLDTFVCFPDKLSAS